MLLLTKTSVSEIRTCRVVTNTRMDIILNGVSRKSRVDIACCRR